MVVISAKFTKKRAVILAVIAAVILIGVILIVGYCKRSNNPGSNSGTGNAGTLKAETNDDRITFLSQYGWVVKPECLESQAVQIPVEFGDVYTRYNELQAKQGFDLKKYSGCEATRYTYSITNYPDTNAAAVADIIVYKGVVIAGDVQSPAIDGFMAALNGVL